MKRPKAAVCVCVRVEECERRTLSPEPSIPAEDMNLKIGSQKHSREVKNQPRPRPPAAGRSQQTQQNNACARLFSPAD